MELLQDRRHLHNLSAEARQRDLIHFIEWALPRAGSTKAQLFQDLWVLWELREKRGGYFCEFGATNGIDLSNTYLLENEFGWNGILAEPNPIYHAGLNRDRRCHISSKCVYGSSGQTMQFSCASIPHLSRLLDVVPDDQHERTGRRVSEQIIEVEAISLNDLLDQYCAPVHIDYISMDTEGSEFEILSRFDFARRTVATFSIEHNFSTARERIHALLTSHGYVRRFEHLSQFDDWYIRRDLLREDF
jgi:hypothetical protein